MSSAFWNWCNPWFWAQVWGRTARPKVTVTALAPRHARAVAALHAASFASGWEASEIEPMLSDKSVLAQGAFEAGNGGCLGFVLSRAVAGEAEILTIAVSKAARGSGVGATLLGHHLAALAAAGVTKLFLEVEDGNGPALGLYRRFGFVEVGRRASYYRKPDGTTANAIIMRRDL